MKPARRSLQPANGRAGTASSAQQPGNVPAEALQESSGQRVQAAELWVALHLPAPPGLALPSTLLEAFAARALQFTPRVSIEPPDGLLFEVRGSLHLFGGTQALCRSFQERCQDLCQGAIATPLSLALAPTPLAALALARSGRLQQITAAAQLTTAVAGLSLRSLRWPEATLTRLLSMGVRTIGEALRLPRAGLARRCGPELLICLDRLLGRRSDPRSVLRLRERFRAQRELHYESAAQDRILNVLRPMLQEMESFLRQRQCGVNVLELRLAHRNLPDTRCLLRLALPQHLAQEFTHLLQEHLSRLQLPEAVRSCRLRSGRLLEQAPVSGGLWQPGEQGGAATLQMPAFIERLRARLGAEAVYGLCLVPEHRPEAAWSIAEPVLKCAVAIPGLPSWSPQHRPLWLLQAPRKLAMRDGRPCHRGHPLRFLNGPERLETGWWDGKDICRDYYAARAAQGEQLWVFRERGEPHGWFLHGMFG
jgi:protein ImuB